MLFIVSTYGEGDPPQPSVGFFEFLEGPRAPKLDGVRFSVLALGDSTYEKYCEAGKRLDSRLEELGATRLSPRVDCDIDYDDPAAGWSEVVVQLLAADQAASSPQKRCGSASRGFDIQRARQAQSLRCDRARKYPDRRPPLDQGNPPRRARPRRVGADLRAWRRARHRREQRSACGRGTARSDRPVRRCRSRGEERKRCHWHRRSSEKFEITIGSPRFIEQWAQAQRREGIEALTGADMAAERVRFLYDHHIVDIVRQFPVEGVDAASLLAGLRPLQPRLYSIASSLGARRRRGAPDGGAGPLRPARRPAAAALPRPSLPTVLELGSTLPVYVQENPHFRLPGRRRADHHGRRRHRRRAVPRLPAGARGARRRRPLLAVLRRAQLPQRLPLPDRMAGSG